MTVSSAMMCVPRPTGPAGDCVIFSVLHFLPRRRGSPGCSRCRRSLAVMRWLWLPNC